MEEQHFNPGTARKGVVQRFAPIIVAVLVVFSMGIGGVSGSAATIFWLSTHTTPTPSLGTQATTVVTSRQVSANPTGTDIGAIYNAASPAVVSVSAVTGSSNRSRGFTPQSEAGGTGFIVNNQGYILTNNHVVQGAAKVTVTLLNGSTYDAKVTGTDPASDLALLKAEIPQDAIVVATLGDSDQVQPGDLAIAIGNPFGLDHTLTSGIVSAVNREFGTANGRPMRGLIQTDAPINPGNSGGPLFNAKGEVVGITASIESPIQGSVGIGFAIPINKAKGLLPQLQTGQKVDHTYLGITGSAITPDFANTHKVPVNSGILVVQVAPNGPAAKAGLKGGDINSTNSTVTGDIITEVDGRAVKTVPELSSYIDTKSVGDPVTLTIVRDNNTIKVQVTLAAWPTSNGVSFQRNWGQTF